MACDTSTYEPDPDGTVAVVKPSAKPIKQEKKDVAKTKAEADEVMADPDFMAELDALNTER